MGNPVTFTQLNVAAGSKGFDVLTPPTAVEFVNYKKTYSFYVGYCQQMNSVSLGHALEAGLAVMLAMGYYAGMVANMTGKDWGDEAVNYALNMGYLSGCNIWLDLEDNDSLPSTTIQWCNDWASAVSAGGYIPGLYVGANTASPTVLTASQLGNLKFSHYWKSLSTVNTPSPRRFQMIQTGGSGIDIDTVEWDNEEGLPIAELQINNLV